MRALNALIGLAFLLVFGIVGHFDAEDEKAEALAYCQNVKAGIWPDFKQAYQSECVTKINEEISK